MTQQEIAELVGRVNALEQNQIVIRKDVDHVQREVRDVANAERLTDVEEQLERVFDEGYDPASQSQELVDCRKRIYSMEQSLLREDAISADEKCLVMMYRFIKKRGGNEGTPKMQLRADSNGFMEMGFE